jgi:transcriptional regulator with XRE-family HTH domain
MTTIGAVMPRVDGEKLRALREVRFLSHRDLARRASVSPTTILNLEAERVEAQRRTIRKLAEALDVEPHQLVKEADDA